MTTDDELWFTLDACPVCSGVTTMPVQFYTPSPDCGSPPDPATREPCHTCGGAGCLRVEQTTGAVSRVQIGDPT